MSGRGRAGAALLLGCAACAQAEAPLTQVTVTLSDPPGLPAGTATVEIRSDLGGRNAKTQVLSYLALRFGLRLPTEWAGPFHVAVRALSAAGCELAQGEGTTPVPGQPALALKLEETARRGCLLSLQVVGAGQVVVQPGGEICAGRCERRLRQVPHLLSAEGAAFVGWSGACQGAVPLCLLQGDQPVEVTATFR